MLWQLLSQNQEATEAVSNLQLEAEPPQQIHRYKSDK